MKNFRMKPITSSSTILVSFLILASCKVQAKFEDTVITSSIFHAVKDRNTDGLLAMMQVHSNLLDHRSNDGRGLLWWSHEFHCAECLAAVMAYGSEIDLSDMDANGVNPTQLCSDSSKEGQASVKCSDLMPQAKSMLPQYSARLAAMRAAAESAAQSSLHTQTDRSKLGLPDDFEAVDDVDEL